MEVKQITVAKSRTVNLGEFNSLRIEYSITAELDAAEALAPEYCVHQLGREVDTALDGMMPIGPYNPQRFKPRIEG